ncbi:methyl-accepting chemotaxis protein [Pelosinus propionicus]|uniref:Methyl-accepting chemotaxis protein n=1 Tax=Pelosinus propionicus DSM 13327 TaxID=1123291 RepID=A0A1I4M3M2_9FIRM|nr:methyl-accepting chemotaxis protein [Pelosinus propionicus]SFL97968.1 methyl-accepting chemotaxis protein [Pelosinus propionicus DSM 13327]
MLSGKRFSIGKQILLAVIIIVVGFSSVNIFNYIQSLRMQQGYDEVTSTAPVINHIKDISTELWLQNAQVRGYALTGDPKYLQPFEASRKRVEVIYGKLDQMLFTENMKKGSRLLRVVINEFNKQQDNAISARNKLGSEQVVKFIDATDERTVSIDIVLQSFGDSIAKSMDKKIEDNKIKANRSQQIVMVISIVIFIVALSAGIWLARRISRPLEAVAEEARLVSAGDLHRRMPHYTGNDEIFDLVQAFSIMIASLKSMVSQVSTAAEQVASSSEELRMSSEQSAQAAGSVAQTVTEVASGASSQLTAIDKAVSISQQMADAIAHIAQSASEVSARSSETAVIAEEGGKSVAAAVGQMATINNAVSQSAAVIDRLGESSRQIGEIVDVIRNIAGQTNLLALNAAIEAARAGEAGRGFAVVADEVRKLAEQSQMAAQKIAQIIGCIQQETSTAVQAMNAGSVEVNRGTETITSSGKQFQDIIELVQNLNRQIINISAATQQLSVSSDSVVGSVSDIKTIAVETSAGAEGISAATEEQSASMQQIAAASQAMSSMAEKLKTEVNKFQL